MLKSVIKPLNINMLSLLKVNEKTSERLDLVFLW